MSANAESAYTQAERLLLEADGISAQALAVEKEALILERETLALQREVDDQARLLAGPDFRDVLIAARVLAGTSGALLDDLPAGSSHRPLIETINKEAEAMAEQLRRLIAAQDDPATTTTEDAGDS